MGQLVYIFGLRIYELMIRIAALFNRKAKLFIAGRKKVWQELSQQLANNSNPILWVHCSSIGEYEQGRPVIEAFKETNPNYKILVTFFSSSGYEAVATDEIVEFKSYLPFDSRKNSKRFIDLVNPHIAIFVKYEFWHFYLKLLREQEIPTYSVSSLFRPEQVFFKWYGGFYRKMLKNIDHFFVQDKQSHILLNKLGLANTITGDTRLDRVLALKNQDNEMPEIKAFCGDSAVMIVGSLRKEDLPIVTEFIKMHSELIFIIAPHEISESMMRPLEKALSSTIRYSNLAVSSQKSNVLIIDNVGMLKNLYRYANYAYIGGGFSDGLHNILEPIVFGSPVFFGNKIYQKFREAIDLIDIGAAFPIGSITEFDTVFSQLDSNNSRQADIKSVLNNYVEINTGATEKIIKHIVMFLP